MYENLPFGASNEHQWIEAYCNLCQLCVTECPPGAIFEQPVEHANGLVTCVETEECFPYFMDNYGCSVCIKVCPFNHTHYSKLRAKIMDQTANGSSGEREAGTRDTRTTAP